MSQTIEEKRVAVARDALAQVMGGEWTAARGYHLPPGCGCLIFLLNQARKDTLSDSELIDWCNVSRFATWFEGWHGFSKWTDAFPNDRERLIALLQNIIRNSGFLVPSDIRPIEPESPTVPTMDFMEPLGGLRMIEAQQLQL